MSYIKINKIRFYCFYFEGLEKPITIEAPNKLVAREKLRSLRASLPDPYKFGKVMGESVKTPVYGVTEKTINGVPHVYVGLENSRSGWIDKKKYEDS